MPTREHAPVTDRTLLLLRAARETGLLDALLDDADTPAEAAAATGVTKRAARVTCRTLAAAGFFERVDGAYEPTNRALGLLTTRDVRSIGSTPRRLDLLDAALALPERMTDGGDGFERHADWTRHRLGAVEATDEAVVRASVTAAVRAAPDADRVLDVGGAPGTYAREFARRGRAVTLVDDEDAIDVSRPLLASSDVDTVVADVTERVPGGYDLAFCSPGCHRRSVDENRAVFAALGRALPDGAPVAVVEYLRDRSPRAHDLAVEALAATEAGDAYPVGRYRSWLRDAGFRDVDVRDVPGTDRQVVTAINRA